MSALCRSCLKSLARPGPSRQVIRSCSRSLSIIPQKTDQTTPFFPFQPSSIIPFNLKGKGRAVGSGNGDVDPEQEVDDREWEMRVARAMLHLRETLPLFFDSGQSGIEMFPQDIYSRNITLKLPTPFPIKISSLAGYSMAYSITKNGMSALHTNLHASLDRMTFSPSPQAASAPAAAFFTKRTPAYRHKQVRVLVRVKGLPRLPPHNEAVWHTSSLYTFSPYSGLIASHEVEKIRPLPGEGVGEWLTSRLLGWTSRHKHDGEGSPIPCPRAVVVEREDRKGARK